MNTRRRGRRPQIVPTEMQARIELAFRLARGDAELARRIANTRLFEVALNGSGALA